VEVTRKNRPQVTWGKTVLLIGGQIEPPSDRVEVWAFNIKTENWSRVEAKGDIPVPSQTPILQHT